jgi:hypothetical protein
VVDVGKGGVEWVGGHDQAAWVGGGLGAKNAINQAVWARFVLTYGSRGCFCVGGNLFCWENISNI